MPFFVTSCSDEGEIKFWEWDVDPLNRRPQVPDEDIQDIIELIRSADVLVLQNSKFDYAALRTLIPDLEDVWDWDKVEDTLIAGHLLASNLPHNLTDMAIQYLGIDIEPYEERLGAAVAECRRVVQQAQLRVRRGKEPEQFSDWRVAKAGLEEMPSAGEKTWKYDTWLPRAMARHMEFGDEGHPYWTVLQEYANADSATTIQLWSVQKQEIKRRNLWAIYRERMKVLPVAASMEYRGITVSGARLRQLTEEYTTERDRARDLCINIASTYRVECEACRAPSVQICEKCAGSGRAFYELEMPKGASPNNSLRQFILEVLKLEPQYDKKSKTDAPTLNKTAMNYYLSVLPEKSKARTFIQALADKRSRDTALAYMKGYTEYWQVLDKRQDWYVLHPSLNPTGTDTLRWSSNNPNEQNISKKEGFNLRYCFGPAPGREWWSMDAQNIELRLPAYEAGEEEMIALFERPNDPPYFGSNHLLVSHILHPEKFAACINEQGQIDGRFFKKKYASTLYQWVKNGNFAVCVPMSTLALTRTGWKSYEEIQVGDLVLGLNVDKLEWTPVRHKVKFENAPLVTIRNNHFKATTTPNHRWVSRRRVRSFKRDNRGQKIGYMQTFVTSQDIGREDCLVISAPTSDKCTIPITADEAALIGFAHGDGSVNKSDKKWGPSRGVGGDKIGFSVSLFQSKDRGIQYVESLLERLRIKYRKLQRPNNGGKSTITIWKLDPEEMRGLWKRAGLWEELDFERFVLSLGTEERLAFLEGVWQAEGHSQGRHRLYTQNKGPYADGIRLAIFMTGHNCTSSQKSEKCCEFREGKPTITGQRITKRVEEPGSVWCVKTDLETWVMRQGDRIMLTGNTYGAVASSGTADRAYHVIGGQRRVEERFTKIKALNEQCIRHAEKYGYVETMPDKTVDPKRGYPLLCTRSEYGKILPTVPLNYHVQGTACWWMLKAMIRCHAQLEQWCREDGFTGFLVMQVHDELVFDFPKAAHPKENEPQSNLWRVRILQKLMAQGGEDIGVPTPVSCEYHPENWSEGISL